jgi:ribosomal protein S18 acetylase RimI-like enzyme
MMQENITGGSAMVIFAMNKKFATPEVFDRIRTLLRYLYPNRHGLLYKDFLATLQSDAVCFAASDHDQIIGIAMITPRRRWYENVWQIDDVVVDPNYRGQLVGAKLIDSLKDEAKRRGVTFIDVATRDKPAVPFYKNLGFMERKESGFYATLRCEL